MARDGRSAIRRSVHGRRKIQQALNNEDERRDGSDRYHIALSQSTHTEGSSNAHGSEGNSERSRYTTDEGSSVVSSYDTESEVSSLVDLGADTEDALENQHLFTAPSYESRPDMVAGWFDFACGWMDRPNMCVGLTGGRQTSLLRQSKLKATSAIRRVKLHETFKQAAEKRPDLKRNIEKSDVEKIQRDVAQAAAAAAESVRKQEIQPSGNTSEQEENDSRKSAEGAEQDDGHDTTENNKISEVSNIHQEEDMEAKMRQVSARAAEILKNTIEARVLKPREESVSPQPKSSPGNFRQQVIKKLTEEPDPSTDEESVNKQSSHDDKNEVVNQVHAETRNERSSRSLRSTHSTVENEEQDITVVSGEIVDLEDINGMHEEHQPELDDATLTGSTDDYFPTSSPAELPDEPKNKESHDVLEDHSITDLTHVEDAQYRDDDKGSDEKIELNEDAVSTTQQTNRQETQQKRSTRLASIQKNDLGKRDAEAIDVFELDDEDSWTPGERNDAAPSLSHHSRSHHSRPQRYDRHDNAVLDQPIAAPNRASLFEANVPDTAVSKDGDVCLLENSAHQRSRYIQRRQQRSHKDEAFNDPQAREAFAGLRRGRLETRERIHERGSRSKSASRSRSRTFEAIPMVADAVETPSMNAASFHSSHQRNFIVDAETALRTARSRDSRQTVDISEVSTDDVSRRPESSTRSKHLVAVRSIDEAQRLRTERSSDAYDSRVHMLTSRESGEVSPYSQRLSATSRESPIVVDHYLEARARDRQEDNTRMPSHERDKYSGNDYSNRENRRRYDYGHERGSIADRSSSYHDRRMIMSRAVESNEWAPHLGGDQPRPDRYTSREQNRHSHMATERRNRDHQLGSLGNEHRQVNSTSVHRRMTSGGADMGRDVRDDDDDIWSNAKGRRDVWGHGVYGQFEESYSRRRDRTTEDGSQNIKELRKLEKKISKQLKQVKQDQKVQGDWDERSVVSTKQLRHLEKKLAQTLRKEDEKRAAKLQRLKIKKSPRKAMMEDFDEPATESTVPQHRRPSPEKDNQDTRYNYGHLKVLRQSRQMQRYMQRTGSRNSRQLGAPRPEAY